MNKAKALNIGNISTNIIIDKLEKLFVGMVNLKDDDGTFLGAVESRGDIDYVDFNTWEWPQGIGLYGLVKYYKKTNDQKVLDILTKWFDNKIEEGLPDKNVNTFAPMLSLAYLYEITGNDKYGDICKSWAKWLIEEMPRTEENGFQHVVSERLNEGQLWDDTLMMCVLFLAKMGKLLQNSEYVEEAKYQTLVHIKYLVDTKTGLFFHGFTFDGRHNFANALWGRGNCWLTIFIPDLIEILDENDNAFILYIKEALKSQVKALKKYQHESGMWHTLIDDPNSYVETSATSGFGYGILKGIRLGILDKEIYSEVGLKALEAVLGYISDDGQVDQVSYGTPMGHDLDFYRNIPITPMAYGQSLAIFLLIESLEYKA